MSIRSDGTITFIYSDELVDFLYEGQPTITRASHVEPALWMGEGWTADMSPSNGPLLGPFKLRQDALDAEVDWLNKKLFGEEHGT